MFIHQVDGHTAPEISCSYILTELLIISFDIHEEYLIIRLVS